MRVGVYVDGFNLYYGGRSAFGKGTPGWKWLGLRELADGLVQTRSRWIGTSIDRVVYCTARIDAASHISSQIDQDIYIRALVAASSIDHVEYGYFVTRVKNGALARRTRGTSFVHVDATGTPLSAGIAPEIVGVAQRE